MPGPPKSLSAPAAALEAVVAGIAIQLVAPPPPSSVSLPPLPLSVSLPPRPLMRSFSALPLIKSFFFVPFARSTLGEDEVRRREGAGIDHLEDDLVAAAETGDFGVLPGLDDVEVLEGDREGAEIDLVAFGPGGQEVLDPVDAELGFESEASRSVPPHAVSLVAVALEMEDVAARRPPHTGRTLCPPEDVVPVFAVELVVAGIAE